LAIESLREKILESNKRYTAGDRTFVLDILHEHIDWRCHMTPEALPVPNRVIGKWHVIEAWKKIDVELELIRNDIEMLVVEGERAALVYDRTLRQRKTGRVIRLKVAAFKRFENGKLIEYQEFGDGWELLEQTLGRSLDAPVAYERGPADLR
jgi:ketosteroid isomerase-like protein